MLEEIAELRAARIQRECTGCREIQGSAAGVRGSRPDVHQTAGAEADEISRNAGPAGVDRISCGSRVFARSADVEADVSALMKEAMATVGGRGGGSKDLAQGGVPDAARVVPLLDQIASQLAG